MYWVFRMFVVCVVEVATNGKMLLDSGRPDRVQVDVRAAVGGL